MESVLTATQSTATTSHEKIRTFIGPSVSYEEMRENIETLRRSCSSHHTTQLILRLKEIVPDYNPSSHLLRRAFGEKSLREESKAQAIMAAR